MLCKICGWHDLCYQNKSGADSEKKHQSFRKFFQNALDELQLEATSLEFFRGKSKPCGTGLLVSINLKGTLEMRAPLHRWKKKVHFTLERIMAKMGKKKNLSAFTTILFSAIKIYFALSFCCHNNKKEIIAYFKNLIQPRVREFIKLYPPKHPHKKISINLKRIIYLLRNSQIKMRKKGLNALSKRTKKKKNQNVSTFTPSLEPPLQSQ